MTGRGRRALALAGALALGCEDEVRAPYDLDQIEEPSEDCVVVVHERLELGVELHQYLADAPGSVGGWALVSEEDDGVNPAKLALVRVPASPEEPETAAIELGYWGPGALHFELRAGIVPGEAWAFREAGGVVGLSKLRPGLGVVVETAYPANDGGSSCPNFFTRQLLLIEGRPYVLALPNCSSSTALELQLLEFDRNSLLLTNGWVLTFDPCASDPQCELSGYPYKLGPIRGGESTRAADADRVEVGFTQVRDFEVGLTSVDVSLLQLWLSAGAPNARILSFQGVWLTPGNLGPVHLAQDLFSTQLHVRNGGNQLDAALLRFDASEELYLQIKSPSLLPLGGRGRLIQLDYQSAMIDAHEGALEAVPLIDAETWPSWKPRTLLELDDLVGFEPAGLGHLLLRREHAPPQLVRLRCLG
ncbi:MAG: hypothetical protein R6X02_08010 [Enhygromyxa sp.]